MALSRGHPRLAEKSITGTDDSTLGEGIIGFPLSGFTNSEHRLTPAHSTNHFMLSPKSSVSPNVRLAHSTLGYIALSTKALASFAVAVRPFAVAEIRTAFASPSTQGSRRSFRFWLALVVGGRQKLFMKAA